MSHSITRQALDSLAWISVSLCVMIARLFHRCLRVLGSLAFPTKLAPAIFLHVSLTSAIATRHITVDTLVAFEPLHLDSNAPMSIGCALAFTIICA